MRPRRLEVEGFTAFRTKTVVDFDGADLFAFVGPTGSGKSSLVDALLFALYGVVPRLGKSAVEPIISLGKTEARVRFDFSVGEIDYVAARVVRRTKTGATTAEARLEGGPESVMGADEVTHAVEALVGLGFDHFTKCVVLPQGEFAAFLQDTPAKKQELLRELLDLGRIQIVRKLALDRQKVADTTIDLLSVQLEDLGFASEEAMRTAESRRDGLAAVREEIDAAEPTLEEARTAAADATRDAERFRREAALLRAIEMPSDLADLTKIVEQAAAQLKAAQAGAVDAERRRIELEKESGEIPDLAVLARVLDLHARLAGETEAEAAASEQERAAGVAAEQAKAASGASDAALATALDRLEEVRRRHAAHSLAEHLEVGAPCPVCRRTVDELPDDESTPDELTEAEALVQQLREQSTAAAAAAVESGEQLASAASRRVEAQRRVAELRESLAGRPEASDSERLMAARRDLDSRLRGAIEVEQEARRSVESARAQERGVGQTIETARRDFDITRDSLAALVPPVAERKHLEEDWTTLVEWAAETARSRVQSAKDLERVAIEARDRIDQQERLVIEKLRGLDLDFDGQRGQRLRDICVEAVAVAAQEVERIAQARSKAGKLAGERDRHQEQSVVAKTLAQHLAAGGFEGWLMAEALEALVDGANQRLDDLSGGAFSLELEKRDFRIIDHRNADERRSVKTLSGGETFLVSLALALALAEQLASMSVHGVARLESMFLDEGFGSLDSESLDVVAAVIHELGSDGRTIGLITHVKDLAEQVPVRFEVRKGPAGATVERTDG